MYLADMSRKSYVNRVDGSHFNIGWLDITQPFPTGNVTEEFLTKLDEKLKTNVKDFYRGHHECQFCPRSSDEKMNNGRWGNGSLYVEYENKVYVAPFMISHYIRAHNYLPPQEFIDAVLHGK